jgi:hypothetical protein
LWRCEPVPSGHRAACVVRYAIALVLPTLRQHDTTEGGTGRDDTIGNGEGPGSDGGNGIGVRDVEELHVPPGKRRMFLKHVAYGMGEHRQVFDNNLHRRL